jgi:hypothetical protein
MNISREVPMAMRERSNHPVDERDIEKLLDLARQQRVVMATVRMSEDYNQIKFVSVTGWPKGLLLASYYSDYQQHKYPPGDEREEAKAAEEAAAQQLCNQICDRLSAAGIEVFKCDPDPPHADIRTLAWSSGINEMLSTFPAPTVINLLAWALWSFAPETDFDSVMASYRKCCEGSFEHFKNAKW